MRTVAGVLETALARLFGGSVKIAAAGRTDSGVHACGQVVSFTTSRSFPLERLAVALNSCLPADVSIREAVPAPPEFSARFSAVERTYVYAIQARAQPSALLARRAWHVWSPLDAATMAAAAEVFVGTHDFRSFCGVPPENGVTARTVARLSVEPHGDLLKVCVAADGFLHHMVRTIVGTLVECATGRRPASGLGAVLAARDRRAAGITAPPHGLYLAGVRYRDGYDSYADPPVFG